MDNALQKLINEFGSKNLKFSDLASEALTLLKTIETDSNTDVKLTDIREKCLSAIELALDCKQSRINNLAINALQAALRDKRLHSTNQYPAEPIDKCFQMQIVHTLHDLPSWSHNPDLQCHCFTILLQLTSLQDKPIQVQILCGIIELSISTFHSATANSSTTMAARATVIQSVNSFCQQYTTIKDNHESVKSDESSEESLCSLLAFFCIKLKSMSSSSQNSAAFLLMLDAVSSIMTSQNNRLESESKFVELIWKELVPLLIASVGDPQKLIESAQHSSKQVADSIDDTRGRGVSGQSSNNTNIIGSNASVTTNFSDDVMKSMLKICGEILRLTGHQKSMRSVLEALFHRFLLFIPPHKRLLSLKALKHIMSNAPSIPDLANFDPDCKEFNLNLWKIILDCLSECATKQQSSHDIQFTLNGKEMLNWAAVKVLANFTTTLLDFLNSSEKFLTNQDQWEKINDKFPTISSITESLLPKKEKNPDSPTTESVFIDSGTSLTKNDNNISDHLARIRSAWRGNIVLSKTENFNSTVAPSSDAKISLRCKLPSFADREMRSATDFVRLIAENLQQWNAERSTIELDIKLQQFAVRTFETFMLEQLNLLKKKGSTYEIAVYNADALYLLIYASLDLCLLQKLGQMHKIPSEDEFVNSIVNVGIIVYVSTAFLSGVYRLLIYEDLFTTTVPSTTIVNLIEDYTGRQGYLLSDFSRLENSMNRAAATEFSDRYWAASKICRILLESEWTSIVKVISRPIDDFTEIEQQKSKSFLPKSTLKSATINQVNDGIAASLEALYNLLILCPKLGLKSKSGWIFCKLVEASCPLEFLHDFYQKNLNFSSNSNQNGTKLANFAKNFDRKFPLLEMPQCHALSIQMVIDNALKIGSLDQTCWPPVTRSLQYVNEFERLFFSQNLKLSVEASNQFSSSRKKSEENTENSVWSNLPSSPVRFSENVADLYQDDGAKKSHAKKSYTMDVTAKVLGVLSAKVVRFYDDTSRCLNMAAMREFCRSLVAASQTCLFFGANETTTSIEENTVVSNSNLSIENRCHFLEQLSSLIIRLTKSSRPLIHIMTVWGVAAPHFVEAACASNAAIGRKSVELLRDCASALLEWTSGVEPKQFYFNETLLQPLQAILCLELSGGDQAHDAALCAIAELVEHHKRDVYAGWKPLFGALKAARNGVMLSTERNASNRDKLFHLHNAFADVFSTFLKSDNSRIFLRASGECISCLLRFLADDPPVVNEADQESILNDDLEKSIIPETGSAIDENFEPDFARTALCFLRQCHSLLVATFEVCTSDEDLVHIMHRLTQKDHRSERIDSRMPDDADFSTLASLADFLTERQTKWQTWNFSPNFLDLKLEEPTLSLPWENLPLGKRLICEAWIDLIEGLSGCVLSAPNRMQPEVIECVFDILDTLLSVPGIDFGAYCMNHLLLPTIQRWLRRQKQQNNNESSNQWRENRFAVRNFKQCVGLMVEAVVKYIATDPDAPCNRLLLDQTCDLLVECLGQSSELVARLGCASLRHLILSLHQVSQTALTENAWALMTRCLWRAASVTLRPVRLLADCFAERSPRYDGDNLGRRVQVAIRRDTQPSEAARVRALAQQVFLADSQKYEENIEDHPDQLSQSHRSVVFILHLPDSCGNEKIIRLPFRKIVVSLLAHQMYLQLIGKILCNDQNVNYFKIITSATTTLTRQTSPNCNDNFVGINERNLGILYRLNNENICSLLCCLDASFHVGQHFDARPGLKFLVQKVFNSPVAANLYKQLATSYIFHLATCYHLAQPTFEGDRKPDLTSFSSLSSSIDNRNYLDYGSLLLINSDDDHSVEKRAKFFARLLTSTFTNVCKGLAELDNENSDQSKSKRGLQLHFLPIVGKNALADKKPTSSHCKQVFKRASSDYDIENNVENNSLSSSDDELYNRKMILTQKVDDRKSEESKNEVVYNLASNEFVENCLESFHRSKREQKVCLTDESIKNCCKEENLASKPQKRTNPFDDHVMQNKIDNLKIGMNEISRSFETYEDPSLKREALSSFMRDSDAVMLAWSEMTIGLPKLILALESDDINKFKKLLPTVYQSLAQLVSITSSKVVKMTISDLMFRVAEVYNIFEQN